jgi:hypothetical protein
LRFDQKGKELQEERVLRRLPVAEKRYKGKPGRQGEGVVHNHAERPKSKCTFLTLPCGLFPTCRREKYTILIQYFTIDGNCLLPLRRVHEIKRM